MSEVHPPEAWQQGYMEGKAEAEERIAELEKDRKRLEWLVRNGYTLLEPEIDADDNPLWGLLDPGSEGLNGWDVTPRHEDWNDAIDAAMRGEAGGDDE